MADNYRYYMICPSCGGTGLLPWGDSPSLPGNKTCPTCEDETAPLGAKVFDGVRHVYAGRFEEVED